MKNDLMKKTAIGSVIFFVISMAVIVYLSANKVITVTNVAQDEVHESTTVKKEMTEKEGRQNLTFVIGEADTSYLRIPLPEGCKANDIVIENHYMDKELWLMIPTGEENFYVDNAISGNRKTIKQGSFESAQDGCRLKFQLTGIYECRTILESNHLYIDFLAPREIYEKIVVIDPVGGGSDAGNEADGVLEKDIALQIARKLKEKLDKSDIKAYYTRMDDADPAENSRIALANEIKADMYIGIGVNAGEDSSIYGTETVYNEDYFIPGFGSVELADCLEKEVVTAIKGKALGLVAADESVYTVRNATIPAALVRAGYITNKQEATLLVREEYADKIATGIYNAILQSYEQK